MSYMTEVEVHRDKLILKYNCYRTFLEWWWGVKTRETPVSKVRKRVEMVMIVLANLCVTAGQKMKCISSPKDRGHILNKNEIMFMWKSFRKHFDLN